MKVLCAISHENLPELFCLGASRAPSFASENRPDNMPVANIWDCLMLQLAALYFTELSSLIFFIYVLGPWEFAQTLGKPVSVLQTLFYFSSEQNNAMLFHLADKWFSSLMNITNRSNIQIIVSKGNVLTCQACHCTKDFSGVISNLSPSRCKHWLDYRDFRTNSLHWAPKQAIRLVSVVKKCISY